MDAADSKARFIAQNGYWNDAMDGMLDISPEFFDAYAEFAGVPWTSGTLPAKTKALIMVAVNSSTTHLFAPALRAQIRLALQNGATTAEITEVFQLTAALGLHTCTMGVPVLFDELTKAGRPEATLPAHDPERQKLKDEFIRIRGYWAEFWDQILSLSPAYFRAYLRFTAVPWKAAHLDVKTKELIYIAIDVATTHLYEQGLRVHIRNAMECGSSPAEIVEVYQLVSTIGMHTCDLGMPMLLEEADRLEREAR